MDQTRIKPDAGEASPRSRSRRASLLARAAIALLRPLLRRVVSAQVVGAEALAGLDRGRPVCWVL
ncbi:MAG: hypothetical protein WCK28_16805 [Burkholderiales bacterium]